jgi:hypothetical protein
MIRKGAQMHEPRRKIPLLLLLTTCAIGIASCSNVNLRSLEETLNKNRPLDEATVVAGLKDALRVGTERGVNATSTVDGFLGNAMIRIALPEQFDDAAALLRSAGLGGKVDELEVAMNRAAERASGEAGSVFWDAITRMSVADAFGILRGEDDAATRYFRSQTEAELRRRFEPIVDKKMEEVGLYRVYEEIAGYYERLPMVEQPALDLKRYVTDHALDGLFTVLAQEEKRIREDPLARSTELLRRVFGSE